MEFLIYLTYSFFLALKGKTIDPDLRSARLKFILLKSEKDYITKNMIKIKRFICWIIGHKWSYIMGHSRIKIDKCHKVTCLFCDKQN